MAETFSENKQHPLIEKFHQCKKWVAENKTAVGIAAGFVAAGVVGAVLAPTVFMKAGFFVAGVVAGAVGGAFLVNDKKKTPQFKAGVITCSMLGVISGGLVGVAVNLANVIGFTCEQPKLPPSLRSQLTYDVCLTPAVRTVKIGAKDVTIEVMDNVKQTTLFPSGGVKHQGEIILGSTITGIFAKGGEEEWGQTLPTGERPGPYDPAAAARLQGCKALTNLDL